MAKPQLGEQEFDLLRYVTEHAPVTVRDVVDGYGQDKGLARTTVLTMMERLRKKGFLVRSDEAGGYQYRPAQQTAEVERSAVRDFVERTLGGSLTPFVAYLAERKRVSDAEVEELQKLVDELKRRND